MKTFVLNGWSASAAAWDLCTFPRAALFSYTDQLEGLPEKALEREESVVLAGWSMGGSSALRLLLKYPDKIKGLVLVAATPCMMKAEGWDGLSPRRLEALRMGIKLTHGAGFFGTPVGKPNPYALDTDANLERGLDYLARTDLRADLTAAFGARPYTGPVGIFHSRRDGIVRPGNAVFLKNLFPSAGLTWVEGSEHALPIHIPQALDAAVFDVLGRADNAAL